VVIAWDAILDASWGAGDRISFHDAVDPLPYDLGDTAALQEALTAEGLLVGGYIREESWASWFTPAWERREVRRRSGTLGGLRSHGARPIEEAVAMLEARDSDGTATLQRRYSDAKATPYLSVPSVPTVEKTAARSIGRTARATDRRAAADLGKER
jgi:hypothetical protein